MPSSDSKSTTSTTPWSGAIPYLTGDPKKGTQGILPEAAGLYSAGKLATGAYPGATVAGFNPMQTAALEGIEDRAMAGSPLTGAAQDEVLKTLEGGYLGQANPYLDRIEQLGLQNASRAAGMFGAGGRTGSGAMQGAVSDAYTSATAPYFFNAYENERGRMGDAARFAPQLADADYNDYRTLLGAGQVQQAQSQAELADQVQAYFQDQNKDAANLAAYQQLISGATSPYNVTTASQPGPSIGQTVLGGLLGLGGLGMGMGFTPFKPGYFG